MTLPAGYHLGLLSAFDLGLEVYDAVCCAGHGPGLPPAKYLARLAAFDLGREVWDTYCCLPHDVLEGAKLVARLSAFDLGREVYDAVQPCCAGGGGSGSGPDSGSGHGGGSGEGSGGGSGSGAVCPTCADLPATLSVSLQALSGGCACAATSFGISYDGLTNDWTGGSPDQPSPCVNPGCTPPACNLKGFNARFVCTGSGGPNCEFTYSFQGFRRATNFFGTESLLECFQYGHTGTFTLPLSITFDVTESAFGCVCGGGGGQMRVTITE